MLRFFLSFFKIYEKIYFPFNFFRYSMSRLSLAHFWNESEVIFLSAVQMLRIETTLDLRQLRNCSIKSIWRFMDSWYVLYRVYVKSYICICMCNLDSIFFIPLKRALGCSFACNKCGTFVFIHTYHALMPSRLWHHLRWRVFLSHFVYIHVDHVCTQRKSIILR